ncbi:YifB family Mg chelatase-like AAA ATPase [Nitratiruptor tergarcus]|uniref:Magnesium chelatase family protein n=1 Tax=Nitratiruptor tergarcus DSM 16512 TaxID=1069081 RepID=A0A1W1WRL6_9BACT|nr:YifB family Mg chelatase-like AAA ATPase [Nitratiruptor tergarcus]SMC08852.1 magnesium chelatase family protein [Nitratiruptor tergarcus DSM 16512]
MKRILCATLDGVEARRVEVESSFTRALPSFSIVGLASNSIQEAKERVKAALLANDFTFPPLKITINLSPSDLKKSGSHFDLAIALSVALQKEKIALDEMYVFGELGLDGRLKDTLQLFPLLLSLSKKPCKAIVPQESVSKLINIPNLTLYPVASLQEAITMLRSGELQPAKSEKYNYPYIQYKQEKFYYIDAYPYDFAEVRGQEIAKRAALIAAVGMHNILLEGSPGCGKSMIAKRLRYILPPMHMSEILDVAKSEALEGKEPDFKPVRPMRSPHHSSTKASIFGGGSSGAKPGEVALANKGVLFFDEFPHFAKSVLEALREPLQDGKLLISRVNMKVEYPTEFMFIAAQNPCPCGNLFSKHHSCRCSDVELQRYRNRLSAPLLDRIEIYVQMQEVDPKDTSSMTSKQMHEIVKKAFIFQKNRGQEKFNAKLDEGDLERYCLLEEDAEILLQKAAQNFSLSFRAINNIKKVARSIADIEERPFIGKKDILEALSFRKRT